MDEGFRLDFSKGSWKHTIDMRGLSSHEMEGRMELCRNCAKDYDGQREGFQLEDVPGCTVYGLCSVSCLMELAWSWREAQPKLSKSKGVDHDPK